MEMHGSCCYHSLILKVVIWTCLFGYVRTQIQCSPQSTNTMLTYSLKENLPSPAIVGNIGADLQSRTNTAYRFHTLFTDDTIKSTFDVDRAGIIKTKVLLDREKKSYYFPVYVEDNSNSTVLICLTINVADVNDNAPHFDNENRIFDIHEGTTQNKFYIGSATDEDIGNNTIAGYRLASGNEDYAFNLTGNYTNPLRNKLLLTVGVNGTLDYEKRKFYNLTVHVYDGGSPRLTATMDVRINVLDVNDNSPVFDQSKYSASFLENTTVGTTILEVHATDIDSGENGNVVYSIDKKTDPDDFFEVNSASGVISLKRMVDYESRKRYDVEVKAQNPGNSIAAVAAIEINVLNVNELPPNIYINYNNNVPKISENASIGSYVARVSVSDPESPVSENNTIEVTLNGAEGKFRLEKTSYDTYMIVVAQLLDRETKPSYNLTLVAADSGIPPLSATQSFVLQLDDVNDNAPVFLQSSYQANVDEMSEAGSSVISIAASDRDIGANGLILYSIRSEPGSISDWFQVDANSGLITTRGQVDCEVDAQPSFWLIATDRGIPPMTSSVKVSVSVRDINDKEPTFDRSMYTATIPENQAVQSCILQLSASDPDCGVNGLIRYSLAGPSSSFTIQQLSGHICVSQALDYETITLHEFSVIATDSGGYSTTSIVQITIEDVNDNAPVFSSRNYSRNIQNSMQPGSEVLTVYATDRDSGTFGIVQYSISSGNTGSKFTINAYTGTISLATSLSNTDQDIRLVIDARDGGNRNQTAEVYIRVMGQGYNLPVFQQSMYRFQLGEDASVNSLVGQVTATYAGSSNGITYTISSGDLNSFFTINSSGQIRTTKQLDHDEYPVLLLSVEARSGSTHLLGTTQVNVTIDDVNDNAPQFISNRLTISVSEAIDSMATIYTARARDKDSVKNGNGVVGYRLQQSSNFLFEVNPTNGTLRLARGANLDYEALKVHELIIVATDQAQKDQKSSTITLTVSVQDANDNTPVFEKGNFVISVPENTSVGLKVGKILATDRDTGNNGKLSYMLEDSKDLDTFGIFPSDGSIYLKKAVDRETQEEYSFTVRAKDHGQPPLSATSKVTIYIQDVNDNSPVFSRPEYSFSIEENLPSGQSVGRVMATDADKLLNAQLQYDFFQPEKDFLISQTGIISTTQTLDRETKEYYNLEVLVRDSGTPVNLSKVKVIIRVTDINDNYPEIKNSPLQASIDENRPKGERVVILRAVDLDTGNNGTVSFKLEPAVDNPDALSYFEIHPESGWITTKEVLYYEARSKYKFRVVASDDGTPSRSTTRDFEILVNKLNNGAAALLENVNMTFYVVENVPIGTLVGTVMVQGVAANSRISYYITAGNIFSLFSVEVDTGKIYTIREIDYEETSFQTIGITAIDNSGFSPKSTVVTVKVNIVDINDNAPLFDKDPVLLQLKENTPVNTVVHTFIATDMDSSVNGTVRYEVVSASQNVLQINTYTGKMSVSQNIDYEQVKDILLVVKATDMAPTTASQLFSAITVRIQVLDENDNVPMFQSYPPLQIFEDEPVGYQLASIIATDADGNVNNSGNNVISYSILSVNNNVFSIDEFTGVLTVASPLDRETMSKYELRILAQDHGNNRQSNVITLLVQVLDVNDNAPQFVKTTYRASIVENSAKGSPLIDSSHLSSLKVTALDQDSGDNGLLSYHISEGIADDFFDIDPVTGLVSFAADTLDREAKSSYAFTVYVQDNGSPRLFDKATVIVNITDLNDNNPVFKEKDHFLQIPENLVQDGIYQVAAQDADEGENARIEYSIIGGNTGNKFVISSETGFLSLREALDRETVSDYILLIKASDRRGEDVCEMSILVQDQNDNDPVFQQPSYEKLLVENVPVGISVVTIRATDADEGSNGAVTYSIVNDSGDASLFDVNSTSGLIITKGLLDREKKGQYNFEVQASDGGIYDKRSEKVRVEIVIGDINDNAPVFQEVPYTTRIAQNMEANAVIITVKADDKDAGKNGDVTYQLTSNSEWFMIDRTSGAIKTKKVLGADALGYHNLQVVATDGGDSPLSATGVVEINVGGGTSQIQFTSTNYTSTIPEHSQRLTSVVKVALTTVQPGLVFSFASGNTDQAFSISLQGLVTVNNPEAIDYEESQHIRLIVAATVGNEYAYTTVWVSLQDINDNPPLFSQNKYVTKFYEEQPSDTFVMQVSASDADSIGNNSDIVYHIIGGNDQKVFTIDPPKTGIIKTNVIVDYEVQASYILVIEARDDGTQSLSSTCVVKINIIDTNDNPPKFPMTSPVDISENADVGTTVAQVTANDIDKSPAVMYNFTSAGNPDGMFSLDRYSGIIRLARHLDFETRRSYVVVLQASDGVHTVNTTQQVRVIDENDNAPQFVQQSYKVLIEESTVPDRWVIRVNATDGDTGANAAMVYRIAHGDALFYINQSTGVIYTKGALQFNPNNDIIQVVVMASDSGTPQLSAVVAVYVQVTSVNKFTPQFLSNGYSSSVYEDISVGLPIIHTKAVDNDTQGYNKEIDYFIVGGNSENRFTIDQKNGSIILNRPLDRERIFEYNLIIMAKDRGLPPKNSNTTANIRVLDVNDQVPYFEFNQYSVTLNESFPNETRFLIARAFDDDQSDYARLYYTITSGNEDGLFIINGSTGEIFITPMQHLDYERNTYHRLIVKVSDCAKCNSSVRSFSNITTVHVNVTDVNEYSPQFPVLVYFEGVNENTGPGSSVFEVHANDKDGGVYGEVTYTIAGTDQFSVHYKTGLVTNNVQFDYEAANKLEFQFKIWAEDFGGKRNSIDVKLRLLDEDEYAPVFENHSYSFDIPGDAKKGTVIGRVSASDADGGNAGRLVYRIKPAHKYFAMNASNGDIIVINDLNKQIAEEGARKKREVNALYIEVSSGMADSKTDSVVVDVNVDRDCPDCAMQKYVQEKPSTGSAGVNLVYVLVPIAIVIIVVITIFVFLFVRKRRGGKSPPPSETPMCDSDEFDTVTQPNNNIAPNYQFPSNKYPGGHHTAHNTTTSSNVSGHSGSSGRGSAEDDDDEELAMINSSSPSYLNNSNGFRKNMPDSGIQDDDNTSEPSVQNHQDYLARLGIDTAKINSKAKSGLGQSVESMHQFSDSGGGEGTGLELGTIDYTKLNGTSLDHDGIMDKNNDMGFHEPEPNLGSGSLSNVINSEEEYSGSYNWDYLLDWGPQYQPLASVFSEIARLKDDSLQPKKQAVQIVPQQRHVPAVVPPVRNIHPPPMITNAPPKAQPVVRSNRTSHSSGVSNLNSARSSTINTSLPSMPRSPISHESSYTSPALTPSFTPSLSPLATRSPSVSPVNSGRGQLTPRGRGGNTQFVFSSSSSEQELRI